MSGFWGPLGLVMTDWVTFSTLFNVPKGYLCPHQWVTRPERWQWLPDVPMVTGRAKAIPDVPVSGSFGGPGDGFSDTRCTKVLPQSPQRWHSGDGGEVGTPGWWQVASGSGSTRGGCRGVGAVERGESEGAAGCGDTGDMWRDMVDTEGHTV